MIDYGPKIFQHRVDRVEQKEHQGVCVDAQLVYGNQGRGLYREACLALIEGGKVQGRVFLRREDHKADEAYRAGKGKLKQELQNEEMKPKTWLWSA